MGPIHRQEKDQFKKLFRQEHIDRFEDRFAVLNTFLQTETHITVDDLTRRLAEGGCDFNPSFVEETLQLMCRFGFAQRNRFDNGVDRFEHRHLGQHHDHMICTKCKSIIEFQHADLEELQNRIAVSHGFHMLQHKMEIYGICNRCLKEQQRMLPLAAAKAGEQLRVKEFSGGTQARMRLLTMGLRVGDRLEVITNHASGQVVVAVGFHRYVLGRGLAQKIMVERYDAKRSENIQAAG
jgi:Fur family ferric uptake transcriptional regulator